MVKNRKITPTALKLMPTALSAAWETKLRKGPLVSLSCWLRVSLERFRPKVRLSHPSASVM